MNGWTDDGWMDGWMKWYIEWMNKQKKNQKRSIETPEYLLNMFSSIHHIKEVKSFVKKSTDYHHILNNNQLLRDVSASCIKLIIPKWNKNALNINVIACTGKESWQSRKAIYEKFQLSKLKKGYCLIPHLLVCNYVRFNSDALWDRNQ